MNTAPKKVAVYARLLLSAVAAGDSVFDAICPCRRIAGYG
jgi:hypothetical protein